MRSLKKTIQLCEYAFYWAKFSPDRNASKMLYNFCNIPSNISYNLLWKNRKIVPLVFKPA